MGNFLGNHDVLGVIYGHTKNYKCMLVSKEFYNIILKNGKKCTTCNKITKIFNNNEWTTHNDDVKCHGYYRDLEYYKMIRRMIQLSPKFFGKIERQCYALNVYAINISPSLIKYIKDQTPELCEMAINKDISAIKFICYPSEDLCLKIINKSISTFQFINNPNEKICLEAVKIDGLQLKYVNDQTYEICLEAVKNNGLSLQYVHDDFKTYEIHCQAVNNDGLSLQYINKEIQTQYLCDLAINNDYNGFVYVDEKYQSFDMCMIVIANNPYLIRTILNQREEYYVEIFKKNPSIFNNILYPSNITTGANGIALGMGNIMDGYNNTCVGHNSGINIVKNNNIMIGNDGSINDDSIIKIGTNKQHIKNYQAGIFGSIIADKNACPVFISPSGQMGTILSRQF